MKKLLFITIFLPTVLIAQTTKIPIEKLGLFPDSLIENTNQGKVIIHQDAKIQEIVNNYKTAYASKKITGWRVQIFFYSGPNGEIKAKNVINKFKMDFPDVPAYLEYEEPFFKVRVGDFLTKLEAAKFKRILEENGYNKVFLVEEEINLK